MCARARPCIIISEWGRYTTGFAVAFCDARQWRQRRPNIKYWLFGPPAHANSILKTATHCAHIALPSSTVDHNNISLNVELAVVAVADGCCMPHNNILSADVLRSASSLALHLQQFRCSISNLQYSAPHKCMLLRCLPPLLINLQIWLPYIHLFAALCVLYYCVSYDCWWRRRQTIDSPLLLICFV